MVQVDLDMSAVHRAPDVVKALVDVLFEHVLIDCGDVVKHNFGLPLNADLTSLLVKDGLSDKLSLLVEDE